MGKKGKTKYVKCPQCKEEMEIPADAEVGDIISCYDCDAEFELVSLKPLKLEPLDDDDEWKETEDD